MSRRFDGKVALITGGASGIGRATAIAFARDGARVVVADCDAPGGEATVDAIRKAEGEAMFVACDVSRGSDVESMLSATIKRYEQLDCAVNNAGIEGIQASIADYPEDVWNRVIGVNLTGPFLCMKYEIPHLLEHGGGAIVNMTSILGSVGYANACAYTASKHAIVGLTQVAALEYATRGIRVNAICPGFVETPMVMERSVAAGSHPTVYRQFAALHPMGRLGKAEEIAEAVLWLCSDAASFVTGQSLLVDGGYTAQ